MEYGQGILWERASADQVDQQASQFAAMSELCQVLDAVPSALLILNRWRQIVFANRTLLGVLGLESAEAAFGMRPGEVLDCEHARETGGGCGTSEACTTCGAAKAIASCERGAAAVQECRIIQKSSGRALDFRVSTTPIEVGGETFSILALTDIADEKRRRALERVFFHDLLNVAGGLLGYTELLRYANPEEFPEIAEAIARLAGTMVEEIRSQRDLSAAENNDLTVHWEPVNTSQVMADVAAIFHKHDAAQNRRLAVDPRAASVVFRSDRRLLTRVLSNLVKNGLEASGEGQVVTVGCNATEEHVEFWVHNPGAMRREVQLQVFQRSFSTKGAGRGLGTYSIRLLSERYLKGRVSFTSSPETGTIFRVCYPRAGVA